MTWASVPIREVFSPKIQANKCMQAWGKGTTMENTIYLLL